MPNLWSSYSNWDVPRALVKISANWSCAGTWDGEIRPSWRASRTKWQSTSIYLVRSWKTWFWAMWITDWLSQKRGMAFGWFTPKLKRRPFRLQPFGLTSNGSHKSIFGFCRWAGYNMLLLCLPCNGRMAQKDKPTRKRATS